VTRIRVRPGPVSGVLRAPPSKSYTHRALVVGHLARRPFRIRGPLDADDTRATAAAVARLGTPVHRKPQEWKVDPAGGPAPRRRTTIDCGESGTTLRLVSALAARLDRTVAITGAVRLAERPIDSLLEALSHLGATCRRVAGSGLPIEVRGPMRGGSVTVDASQSSQFISALLLALPTLADDSSIAMTGRVVSEPYIEATLAILAHHGIRVTRRGKHFHVPGGQRYTGSKFSVPGDASSAAYFWTAAALSGGEVRVEGIPREWPQADLTVLELLRRAGARVSDHADGASVKGGHLRPFQIDLTDSPDLYPLAGVLAATIPGTSRITGAEHVVLKESDRKSGTTGLVRRLGARVASDGTGLRIDGTDRPRRLEVTDLTDHRLVMSAAIAALGASGVSVIGEAAAVRKSFPEFWEALASVSEGVRRS
jgi:3-phosphoshikimate 1-carboxyvinyltransferase